MIDIGFYDGIVEDPFISPEKELSKNDLPKGIGSRIPALGPAGRPDCSLGSHCQFAPGEPVEPGAWMLS